MTTKDTKMIKNVSHSRIVFYLWLTALSLSFSTSQAFLNPYENISLPSLGGGVTETSVAIDPAQNAVAVWTEDDLSGNVYVRSATRPPSGNWSAPFDVLNIGVASQVKVVVDDNGNAVACWQVGSTVGAATLPFGTGVWTNYTSFTGREPDIAVNPATGDAILVWVLDSGVNDIPQSSLIPFGGVWGPIVNINVSTNFTSAPSIDINSSGIAFVAYRSDFGFPIGPSVISTFGSISGVNLTWTAPGVLIGGANVGFSLKAVINPLNNNGTVVVDSSNTLYSSTLFYPGGTSSGLAVLDTGAGVTLPDMDNDAAGNIVAVWYQPNGGSPVVNSATFDPNTNSWSSPTPIPSSGLGVIGAPKVAVAPSGVASAVWTEVSPSLATFIEAATLPFGGTWQNIETIATPNTSIPAVAASSGGVAAIWKAEGIPEIVQGTFNTLIPPPPPPPPPVTAPLPPSNLQGEVLKVKFLDQTEYVHRLTWQPSPDPTVVGYRVYRNGVLIAQLNAAQLSYEDHNRRKYRRETYYVVSFNEAGIESSPIAVIIN